MSINTWQELVEEIKAYKSTLPEGTELWYRGQGDEAYPLLPTLLRGHPPVSLAKERESFELFQRFASRHLPSHKNEWELLIDMQHNHIPTRLLDWSESLGISLFFALSGRRHDTDLALFLLDPLKLNAYSAILEVPTLPKGSFNYSYIGDYLDPVSYKPQCPIAVRANVQNERVLAQRCMFTIHGKNTHPIDHYENSIKKLTISKNAVPSIEEFLEAANISLLTVIPDLYGVSNYIRNLLEK